jgi:hypothetical protein
MSMTKKADDGCAKIGQETLRKWCAKNGVVLDPLIAADLVAYIASAVRTDRALRSTYQ